MLRLVSQRWFRVEATGLCAIPDIGGALIVANHGGVVAWDALMMQVAIHDQHARHRMARPLAADLVFQTPVLGSLARKIGATRACQADAHELLERGELVAVFPEGFKGCGKPFTDRYQLQRFGRGGFVTTAVRAQVPIVPCAIVGAEETYPLLADMKPLARLLGLPYFPVTPLFPHLGALGLIPLPSKWLIEFGDPIDTRAYDPVSAESLEVKLEVTNQVRNSISSHLDTLLTRRRHPFLS
ncbi:lysophospholipid acyltransferase family protein [Nocardia brasiliensis]